MAGLDAFGTLFQRGDGGSPEVFTTVAHVTDISAPELSRETHDVTAHDSTDKWREFTGGLKDGGEVSLELNYDPRDHDALVVDLDDDEPRHYRIVWPQGIGQWDFAALMTNFTAQAPHDDKLSGEATFKVSGPPTLT